VAFYGSAVAASTFRATRYLKQYLSHHTCQSQSELTSWSCMRTRFAHCIVSAALVSSTISACAATVHYFHNTTLLYHITERPPNTLYNYHRTTTHNNISRTLQFKPCLAVCMCHHQSGSPPHSRWCSRWPCCLTVAAVTACAC
jgi:hypothetical protein